jgi:hypothetical protein
MKRNGLNGIPTAITIYSEALVDSYRYANGTVHADWFDLDRRRDGAFHLPGEHHIRVSCYLLNHKLNVEMPVTQRHFDKVEFSKLCQVHEIPTIPVYAVFKDGEISQEELDWNVPLISKPVDLAEGRGEFQRWEPVGGDGGSPVFRRTDGKIYRLDEIFDELKSLSLNGSYMLQRQVFNHSVIRSLSGVDALCSVRLPTCCFPDGRVEVLPWTLIRMPVVPGAVTDNMARGSVAFAIEPETGRLASGGRVGKRKRFNRHPVTGQQVVGVEMPFWKETIALCKNAHATAFHTFPTVGWDVAITPEGPLLIEMNIQWVRPAGLPGEVFTGKTVYVDCVLSHMRRLWPELTLSDLL